MEPVLGSSPCYVTVEFHHSGNLRRVFTEEQAGPSRCVMQNLRQKLRVGSSD
jgi:hypothetical protein